MDALMVKYPWSALIAWGLKTLEIRTWRTKKRGDVLICSSGSPARSADARRIEIEGPAALGVTMCIVEIAGCRPFEPVEVDVDGAWCAPTQLCPDGRLHSWTTSGGGKDRCLHCLAPREYAWELRHVRAVERVPMKGRLNFFEVDDAVVRLAKPGVCPLPHIRRR